MEALQQGGNPRQDIDKPTTDSEKARNILIFATNGYRHGYGHQLRGIGDGKRQQQPDRRETPSAGVKGVKETEYGQYDRVGKEDRASIFWQPDDGDNEACDKRDAVQSAE